jgi:uncharacterized protein (DUF1501 family)
LQSRDDNEVKRRDFLKTCLASYGISSSHQSLATALSGSSALIGSSAFNDYKSIVCVFLRGGCDSLPLIVPNKFDDYNRYAQLRQHLAYSQEEALKLSPVNRSDLDVSFARVGTELVDLFSDGLLSMVSNVGPLIEPVSRLTIDSGVPIPKFLSSHSDQVSLWAAGSGSRGVTSGWGGRLFELLQSSNAVIPSNISVSDIAQFTQGESSGSHVMKSLEPESIDVLQNYFDFPGLEAFEALTTRNQSLFGAEYQRRLNSAVSTNAILREAIESSEELETDYDYSSNEAAALAERLKIAARLIEIAPAIGHKRQILHINMYDFDTHDRQAEQMPKLIGGLGKNIRAFIDELKLRGVDENAVLFTQSEFGRTLTINGDGTDHGWGGHQFVAGTPVKGGQIIGDLPRLELDTDDAWSNMIIPQFSIEQYGAQLARWMGVSRGYMTDLFGGYGSFDDIDMDLFR